MIDVERDPLLSLDEARHLPCFCRSGKPTSKSAIYTWATIGCRGQVLECVTVGTQWRTTAHACQEFIDRLTAARTGRKCQLARVAVSSESSERNELQYRAKPDRREIQRAEE